MRNKRQIQLKQSRRQVADLLRGGKSENARIRVESVMREEQMLQAYEVIELFVELLTVRIQLIDKSKQIPGDMIEAVSSLVYAAQRITDLPELQAIRGMLGSKYGKEYIAEASSDTYCRKWHVNENLVRCLAIDAPAAEDKLACLSEIAQENGVEWDAAGAAAEMLPARRVVMPYLAGERTSYSDPRNGPAPPYPPPPPAGGGAGSGYGGGTGAGGGGGSGSGGYYGSHGAPPAARRTAADIAEFAAGPRSNSEEAEGIVKYPTAAKAPPSKASSVADGVVEYPEVAGAGPPEPQKDLTGPDGLGDPSEWDPPPREIPRTAGARGGGAAAAQQPTSSRGTYQAATQPPAHATTETAKPYAEQPKQPAVASGRPVPRVSVLPPATAPQQPAGSPGGLSVSPNSRWAPPPGSVSPRRDTGGHLDAVARWKYQRENPGAARASQSPSPGGGGRPWGGTGPSAGAPGGSTTGGAAPAARDKTLTERQADYDAAPGGPPAKPEYKKAGPPSAPPASADDLSLPTPPRAASPAPPATELDDLQKRFEALKRR